MCSKIVYNKNVTLVCHIEGLAQEGCNWVFGFFSGEA